MNEVEAAIIGAVTATVGFILGYWYRTWEVRRYGPGR